MESAINALEHRGLDRVRAHGADGFERVVGLSVLAFNIHRLGLLVRRRHQVLLKRRRLPLAARPLVFGTEKSVRSTGNGGERSVMVVKNRPIFCGQLSQPSVFYGKPAPIQTFLIHWECFVARILGDL